MTQERLNGFPVIRENRAVRLEPAKTPRLIAHFTIRAMLLLVVLCMFGCGSSLPRISRSNEFRESKTRSREWELSVPDMPACVRMKEDLSYPGCRFQPQIPLQLLRTRSRWRRNPNQLR